MEVLGIGMKHETTLKMRGNATDATERQEKKCHLTAIAMMVLKHIFWNVLYRGIFSRRSPREVIVYPLENTLCLNHGVRYPLCQTISQLP